MKSLIIEKRLIIYPKFLAAQSAQNDKHEQRNVACDGS